MEQGWVGERVDRIEEVAEARVPFILRLGTGIVPRNSTVFQDGDLLYVAVENQRLAQVESILAAPPPPE